MALDLSQHPCFNQDVKGRFGRIHLPVAPKCNIQCNFCNRKYDCVNESRPGVSSQVLSPQQALGYLREMKTLDSRLAVMGVAGPGDPFANPAETMETLRLVRTEFPHLLLCVATNGLNAAPYVEELARLGVSHLTVTMNAIDPEIGRQIYAWVRDGKRILRGRPAAELLLERQLQVVRLCKEHNLIVKINSILIPGVNDTHIEEVAQAAASMGADLFNCIPMCRAKGAAFEGRGEPDPAVVRQVRVKAQEHLPQMTHCMRCRADAVGCLEDAMPSKAIELMHHFANGPLHPAERRPYIAVATREGLLVNAHLGQAGQLSIYSCDETGGVILVETRRTPPAGNGQERWKKLAALLGDCWGLLVADAGPTPTKVLEAAGVKVVCTESLITQAIEDIYHGRTVLPPSRPRVCGASCGGNAKGCA